METITSATTGCVLVFCATKLEVMMAARRICDAIVVGIHGPHSTRRVAQRGLWAKEDAARQRLKVVLHNQQQSHAGSDATSCASAAPLTSGAVSSGHRVLHVGPHEPRAWLDLSRQRLSEELKQLSSGGETIGSSDSSAVGELPSWVISGTSAGRHGTSRLRENEIDGAAALTSIPEFDTWSAEIYATAIAGKDPRPYGMTLAAMARLGVGVHHGGELQCVSLCADDETSRFCFPCLFG